jgi:iron complex outermembrane receptor protein
LRLPFARKPAALTLSLAISQLFAAPAALAQIAPAVQSSGIEEIIVTAQKRSENLQVVPISIQALGAKDLEKHNIVTLSDLGAEVPGLDMAPYPGSSEIFFPTFRGITTNAVFISAPNPIAVHVDGVFMSQLVGLNNPAADLERIEVLKGPQGVMAGRNATGGAINIYTAKAQLGEFGFKQQFTFAQRGEFISKTVVNVPIKDDLAVKLSYLHNQKNNDGVSNSAPGGVQFGKKDGDAWHIDLRWKPAKNVMVDYGYDNTESKGYDTPPQCLSFSAPAGANQTKYASGCSTSQWSSLYVPGSVAKNTNKTEGHTLNINWDVNPTLTVRSITGYRKVDTSNNYTYEASNAASTAIRADSWPLTLTGLPGGTVQLGTPMKILNEAWSQEFQFLGDIDKNLKYTSGIYFSSEKGHQSSGPNVGVYTADGMMPGVDFMEIDNKGLSSAKSTSWAVFGQLSWVPNVLDNKLEVVPGARFTHDRRQVTGYNTGWDNYYGVVPVNATTVNLAFPVPQAGIGFPSTSADRDWSKMTPALSLNYHWQQDVMTYVKLAEAYTSGGFDPVAGPGSVAAFTKGFDPETAKTLELGMKGEFLERRLRTNVAVFETKFTNEQKSVYLPLPAPGWTTVNVGGSTYKGLEFDLTAALTDSLRLGFNYATLRHHYDKWVENGVDFTSQRMLIVPKNDYVINVDYRFPNIGLPGKLDGNLNFAHRDRTSTPLNLFVPNVETYETTPAFGIWNARIALSQLKAAPSDEGRVSVALWVKNLADKKYLTMVYSGVGVDSAGYWGEPRSVGLDVVYKY